LYFLAFLQLISYVRHKLAEFYGPEVVSTEKPIPMHLLGNIWAQQWEVDNIVLPYKLDTEDTDAEMIKKGYTPKKMFEDSEQFFTSLGMPAMPESFWKNSIIEKPNDGRDLVCHASAWDFALKFDVRIKQCTRVSLDSYRVVHHEVISSY
jgi:peptidyl-dipeptidase A